MKPNAPARTPVPPQPPGAAADAAWGGLLAAAPPPGEPAWNEAHAADGTLRPAWQRFAATLPETATDPGAAAAEFDRRVLQVQQQLERDGVTHNVFGAEGMATRPWSLELLPLIIEPDDWAGIERGVVQLSTLLERMLADLYGPQQLLHEGLLPPSLLLRHPGWLRPMVGARPAGGQRLFLVGFDLGRGPHGQWQVLALRTQAPSGLGYVLHNRLLVSRQFPEAFRDLRVQHLASSYRQLVASVEARAAECAGHEAPRLVLLTPGPYSETYFEHAYLARYLGLPLVEGSDLTVRGERLFLKTVEGLEPVHGLLRRLDDHWCDPLELRPDSALGVPGLLQAARAGAVVVANALGSAFLETPALLGFLPGIAERLLGEPLALPALPSWWCGEAAAWQDARQQLSSLVLRGTFPSGVQRSEVVDARAAGAEAAVAEDPDAWTVQSPIVLSQALTWGPGMAQLRPAVVRVYAIADADGRWHVLPGGMTRVAVRGKSISLQEGGASLDTWVRTEGPVDLYSMLPQRLSVAEIARRRRPVASRTGENLFWLGRYSERTEQLVRLARATLALIDADSDAGEPELKAVSSLAVTKGLAPEGVPTLVQAPHLFERALLSALGDERAEGGACSVAFNLAALESAAAALRERLSSEQWSLVRRMREGFRQDLRQGAAGATAAPTRARALAALELLAVRLAAVTGAQSDRMTRDHGWRLLTVGRLLDRLIGISTRLAAFIDAGALRSPAGIELLLELFDSVITFRARYQRHDDLLALADLLVLDSTNPRSFAGVLRRLRTEIGKLPGTGETLAPLLQQLPAQGMGLTLEALGSCSDDELARTLRDQAMALADMAMRLSDDIGERYFNLAHGQDRSV